jgi:DNA mismatch repair protein MSH4
VVDEYEMALELKFEAARQYYIRILTSELMERPIPDEFINVYHNRKSKFIECQTLELVKLNQKILDSHHEVIRMSDQSIQDLISDVRAELYVLFKISEAIAELDMIASFCQVVTTQDYTRPELTETLAIKSGRHPIYEKVHPSTKFIPNDVYATQSSRFHIITGCNMSGKSTYIRSIALITVMAQIGCFIPAQYASIPIRHHLFARVTASDAEISANVSTFSAEMREMAFILRNISPYNSMVIIDELGRGTATTDGLHIALAISEALLQSFSLVWFATHFHDLARILAPRPGVVNMHLAVHMPDPHAVGSNNNNANTTSTSIKMLYKVSEGPVQSTHYGLALAQVVGLPAPLIAHATTVSEQLTRISAAKKEASTARVVAVAKRRKLILSLNEQLKHARDSEMQGDELREWLAMLKREFCMRMAGIEAVEGIGRVAAVGGDEVESTTDYGDGASGAAANVAEWEEEEGVVTLQTCRYSESMIEADRDGERVDKGEEDVAEEEIERDDEHEQDRDEDRDVKREVKIVPGSFFDEEEYEEEEEEESFDAEGDDYGADEEKDWLRSN